MIDYGSGNAKGTTTHKIARGGTVVALQRRLSLP
jgi:hypothetical protein